MKTRTKLITAGAAIGVIGLAGVSVAGAGSGDTDHPITGAALRQASAAALTVTGQGRVTETEVGDEDSYYEVEVTLDDGRQVDVQLDQDFGLVKTMADSESTKDIGP